VGGAVEGHDLGEGTFNEVYVGGPEVLLALLQNLTTCFGTIGKSNKIVTIVKESCPSAFVQVHLA
jgi:hypothetical protein